MRMSVLCAVLLLVGEMTPSAQLRLPPPGTSLDVTAAEREAIIKAYREVGSLIYGKASANRDFQGMGTTCSCLVLLPQGALVAHIGDSRIYRLRGDVLEQLTFDHSLVWEMAAAGQMAEADVPSYIPKNVITRSLGPHPSVHIDLEGPYSAESGDKFLICSDGLSGPVTDEEIGAILFSFS